MNSSPESFDFKSMLTNAYTELKELRSQLNKAHQAQAEPIAIIGMGCRFPMAPDLGAYWEVLRTGKDAVGGVPGNRWDWQAYYDENPGTPGKTYSRWGGFIENIEGFDPQFFDISPREALTMDPQQRLFLEVAWEAFEEAGYPLGKLAKSDTGVFVGSSYNGYYQRIEPALTAQDHTAGIGNQNAIIANRISFFFNLRGPSVLVDTMCSSSLVAVHTACQSLRNKECSLALVGGVNVLLSPQYYAGMSRMKVHSPNGRCKAFDGSADGIVLGEGAGAVVLKPLARALADGDRIRAVIRGSAINHGGETNGLTAPNPRAQAELVGKAFAAAGLSAEDISYVEAHGTGTPLGDPIEIEGLTQAFRKFTGRKQFCAIGSVKTNIGHLEAAAGIAQLIKVVLAMEKQQLPPSLHFRTPNPHIPFRDSPFVVNTALTPWQPAGPRRAGMSSFGIGGANAHVIVEEAPTPRPAAPGPCRRPLHVLTLSATTPPALRDLATRYLHFFEANPGVDVADVCYSANTTRNHFRERFAVVVDSVAAAREKLAAFLRGNAEAELPPAAGRNGGPPSVAFLFTGQGVQYAGMCRQLFETQPSFRQTLLTCNELLKPLLDVALVDVLFGDRGDLLNRTDYTQPALFAVEYALATLWQSWGIRPDVVMGHSAGEYVAACIAGVFTLPEGLRLVAGRGKLMQALPGGGKMLAVFAGRAVVSPFLAGFAAGAVSVAAFNAPENTVIAGRGEAVEAIGAALEAKGVKTKFLKVSHAFHSPLMEPMLGAFADVARRVSYAPPAVKLIANVSGELAGPATIHAGYWSTHIMAPVQFARGMNTLAAEACEAYLEIGPDPVLLALEQAPGQLPHPVQRLAGIRASQSNWESTLQALARLYVMGASVDWVAFDRDYGRQRVGLPLYPFQRERYWLQPGNADRPVPPAAKDGEPAHPLLGTRLPAFAGHASTFAWQNNLDKHRPVYLGDHRVEREIVMPFAAYIEMALAAGTEAFGVRPFQIREMSLPHPLLIPEERPVTVQSVINVQGNRLAEFKVFSQAGEGAGRQWTLHAEARLQVTGAGG